MKTQKTSKIYNTYEPSLTDGYTQNGAVICAETVYTKEMIYDFSVFSYANKNPNKNSKLIAFFLYFLCSCWLAMFIIRFIGEGNAHDIGNMFFPIGIIFLIAFFEPLIMKITMSNLQGDLRGNAYIFNENHVRISSKSKGISGQSDYEYSSFHSVYETPRYFYLFLNDERSAYMIQKCDVKNGRDKELSEFLRSKFPHDKYHFRNVKYKAKKGG